MKIQLNTDKNIPGLVRLEDYFSSLIKDKLSFFSDHITRIEVHLADENGKKKGVDDKRCTIEVRLKNKQPIAVTSHANTLEEVVNDALEKLTASIQTILGQQRNH